MTGDCHVPFCGSPGVKSPRATRPSGGLTALIVDDVFRSDDSMNETARAELHADAACVHGIAAVRTMRR
jgi:hypothetical protein